MKTSLWFVQTSRRVNGMSQDNGGDDDDGGCGGGGGGGNRMFKQTRFERSPSTGSVIFAFFGQWFYPNFQGNGLCRSNDTL